jgi:CheY-like chemotaxis protein
MAQTCLIAETDPFIAKLLARFADACGLVPLHASAGQDVMGLARQAQPAVIILDTGLPGRLRGWQIAAALNADPELCHIPVIACAWPSDGQDALLAEGAASYLYKPDLHYADFTAALANAGCEIGCVSPGGQ